jgi:hypothetical protein
MPWRGISTITQRLIFLQVTVFKDNYDIIRLDTFQLIHAIYSLGFRGWIVLYYLKEWQVLPVKIENVWKDSDEELIGPVHVNAGESSNHSRRSPPRRSGAAGAAISGCRGFSANRFAFFAIIGLSLGLV